MTGAFAPVEAPSPLHHWRLLVTDRLLGAFGPGTSAAIMGELWRAASGPGGGLDALVAAVPLRGADAVSAFAVAVPGRSTTFVVRGGGCADVGVAGRIRRIDARGNEPWYVAELAGVDRFALGPLERAAGEVLPGPGDQNLGQGIALGPWVGWTAASAPPRTGEIPTATGDTNVLTDLGRRAAALTRRRGEPPATSPTPETERAASFRVGVRPPERVDAPVYIGRQPRSPRITGPVVPRLVRVDSPSREVSATHVELRPTPHGLVLTDLESTNGTVIRQPGHGVRRLASGESLPVPPGTLIDIGDGNVIEILPYR